jgi:ribosomal protein S18 acetylase RimI-like enzyme
LDPSPDGAVEPGLGALGSALTVRDATPSDAEWIAVANEAMAMETEGLALDPDTVRRGVRAVLEGGADGRYFLAEASGRPVGQLMVTREWSDWRAAHVWWIQSVWVAPEARRLGAYRALHQAAHAAAMRSGAAGIRLYVDTRNVRAMAVYWALGMDGDHYRVFEQLFPKGSP